MTDRQIIFGAPMVRALLEWRKTQTRRVLKPQPQPCGGKIPGAIYENDFLWPTKTPGVGVVSCKPFPPQKYLEDFPIPYAPGDRLWVREACALWTGAHRDVVYRASVTDDEWAALRHDAALGFWTTRSPIHMPRWASRITLTVTDVRVQRLQEISEADAAAEGVVPTWPDGVPISHDGTGAVCIAAFRDLWNSIHGPDAWDANPWVAAISFSVQRGNIDRMTPTPDRSNPHAD